MEQKNTYWIRSYFYGVRSVPGALQKATKTRCLFFFFPSFSWEELQPTLKTDSQQTKTTIRFNERIVIRTQLRETCSKQLLAQKPVLNSKHYEQDRKNERIHRDYKMHHWLTDIVTCSPDQQVIHLQRLSSKISAHKWQKCFIDWLFYRLENEGSKRKTPLNVTFIYHSLTVLMHQFCCMVLLHRKVHLQTT